MGRKIKFMGSEDVRSLAKGEDWSGRLADPLPKDVVWNWDNDHIVDTDEAGLSDEAVELLLTDDGFKDVTDLKRIPANLAQKMWRGTQDPTPNVVNDDGEADVETKGEGGTAAGASGTTVGGSTTPSTGRSAARSGRST